MSYKWSLFCSANTSLFHTQPLSSINSAQPSSPVIQTQYPSAFNSSQVNLCLLASVLCFHIQGSASSCIQLNSSSLATRLYHLHTQLNSRSMMNIYMLFWALSNEVHSELYTSFDINTFVLYTQPLFMTSAFLYWAQHLPAFSLTSLIFISTFLSTEST